LVSRPRLVERLANPEAPIGVVIAPPGFGKTTLLVQSQNFGLGPFAWLSLDDEDNDPVVFWSSLVASIARVVPGFGASVAPALSSVGGLALNAVVARIDMDGDFRARRVSALEAESRELERGHDSAALNAALNYARAGNRERGMAYLRQASPNAPRDTVEEVARALGVGTPPASPPH